MRIGYFDCSSGVSGNMILGALLSAGLPQSDLQEDLQALGLPGWELRINKDVRKSITGLHVEVVQTVHEHAHRNIRDIEKIIRASQLPQAIQDKAMDVFKCIAHAEGLVHGIPDTEVHFHEVGAIDSIVDVVGSVAGIHRLELDAVFASSIHLGSGFIEAAHGRIPIPAPATLEILRGVPVYSTDVMGELATPTGAAVLRTLAAEFGSMPPIQVESIGYGLGTKDFVIPNVLRFVIGTLVQTGSHGHISGDVSTAQRLDDEQVDVLEANLDDMNPEFCQHILSLLLETGALDAFYTPIIMKKGRPALKLTALCPSDLTQRCAEVIFRESTTLGIRYYPTHRFMLDREWINIRIDNQSVRVKIGKWKGQVVNIAPEYEDCVNVATTLGRTLKNTYEQAKALALSSISTN